MAFSVRVLNENITASRNVTHLAIASLVFNRTIKPDC